MLGGLRDRWSWIILRFVGRNQITEVDRRLADLYEWDGVSMMTRRHRVNGKYQQPERVLSPAALDYMSALVQGE